MGCCGRKKPIKPAGTDARKAKAVNESTSTNLGSRRTMTFNVQTKTGKTLTFASKLEAKAEVARNGGILKF